MLSPKASGMPTRSWMRCWISRTCDSGQDGSVVCTEYDEMHHGGARGRGSVSGSAQSREHACMHACASRLHSLPVCSCCLPATHLGVPLVANQPGSEAGARILLLGVIRNHL